MTDLWGCPSGYLLHEMNCYKQIRTAKMFGEAEVICRAEGGSLAKPITLLQVTYLAEYWKYHHGQINNDWMLCVQ